MPTRELFERYYETYNSEDPQALARFYADDVVMTSPTGETHGPEAILKTYRYLIDNFHDKMTPESIEIEGNQGVVRITDRFRAKRAIDNFLGRQFKPGDEMTLHLIGTYTVTDGKIISIHIAPAE